MPQPVTAAVAAVPLIGRRRHRPAPPRPSGPALVVTAQPPPPPRPVSRTCQNGECHRCPGKVMSTDLDSPSRFELCGCTRKGCTHKRVGHRKRRS